MSQYDALVIGSGITGGWAAKTLCEAGLRTLIVERGAHVEHGLDYVTESAAPWEMELRGLLSRQARERYGAKSGTGLMSDLVNGFTDHFFTTHDEDPYETSEDLPFDWVRGYQLGGRSLTWARSVPRWSEEDFKFSGGLSAGWPISYNDLAPYYDEVEAFIGVSGNPDRIASMPDGRFDPPMPMNLVEEVIKSRLEATHPDRRLIMGRTANLTNPREGRGLCQYRDQCARGCSYGAYFSSLSSTLPAAKQTGRLEIATEKIVEKILLSETTGRATGVIARDPKSGTRIELNAKLVVLCASALNSLQILLASKSNEQDETFGPSGVLGHYIMDHPKTTSAVGMLPGFSGIVTKGRRPTTMLIPRYRELEPEDGRPIGSYFHQLIAFRLGWSRGAFQPGIGAEFTQSLKRPGEWLVAIPTFHECLPDRRNHVKLVPTASQSEAGSRLKIAVSYRGNEQQLMEESKTEASQMIGSIGGHLLTQSAESGAPGAAVHEMGGARMGSEPGHSVVNEWNQLHNVPNVLVTDGACMVSSASQNPSLTYMALTLRACRRAASELKAGRL